jgi:hypothetical protein
VTLPPDRLLVIDESLDKRRAHQLEQRGRRAMSAERLGLLRMLDPEVLRALRALDDTWVLVTADDDMPGEHGPLIASLGSTIATVDGRRYAGWGREQWKKEIVHRWAHTIQEQGDGTIVRYGLTRPRPWTRRRGR